VTRLLLTMALLVIATTVHAQVSPPGCTATPMPPYDCPVPTPTVTPGANVCCLCNPLCSWSSNIGCGGGPTCVPATPTPQPTRTRTPTPAPTGTPTPQATP
jgi:hypothetical protein